jgi:hypothetical protein
MPLTTNWFDMVLFVKTSRQGVRRRLSSDLEDNRRDSEIVFLLTL